MSALPGDGCKQLRSTTSRGAPPTWCGPAGSAASRRQAARADICMANGGHDGCRLRAGVLVGFTRPDAARSSRCGRTHGQGLGAAGIRVGGSLRTAAAAVRPHHHQQRPRLVARVQVDRSRCSRERRWLASLSERDDVSLSGCRKSGGGGNRTRVRGRTGQNLYKRSPPLSLARRPEADALPTGQPSFGVALRAIGSPSAPSPLVGAATRTTGPVRSDDVT
jgi:hypothetical protein